MDERIEDIRSESYDNWFGRLQGTKEVLRLFDHGVLSVSTYLPCLPESPREGESGVAAAVIRN